MRIAHIFIAVLLSVVACKAGAIDVWAPTIGEENYIRAKKYTPSSTSPDNDGNMCWAAAASNLIEYWQQRYVQQTGMTLPKGIPAGSEGSVRDSQVFDEFYKAWTNRGLGVEEGLYWYFSGAVATNVEQYVTPGSGGYWEKYCAQLGYKSTYEGLRTDANSYCQSLRQAVPTIENRDLPAEFVGGFGSFVRAALESGSLVGLSLVPDTDNPIGGHAITLYGAKYDDNDGSLLGVYVDDNNKKSEGIVYLEVGTTEKKVTIGDGKDNPYEDVTYDVLKLTGVGTTVNGFVLNAASYLSLRIVPEPTTSILALVGLSLLSFRRRRLQ